MEALTLSTPITVTAYRLTQLILDWQEARIRVSVRNVETGEVRSFTYTGTVATNLMTQLNKLDLSTNSLHKRILERLVSDDYLPSGAVTGSPD